MIKWTDEELIEIYRNFAKQLNKTPTQNEMQDKRKSDDSFPAFSVFVRRFGSQNKLNEICGLSKNYIVYSKDDLINFVKNYYQKFGKIPTKNGIYKVYGVSDKVIYNNFKSFKDLLLESGIDIGDNIKRYDNFKNLTDKELLELFKNYYNKNGFIQMKDLCYKNNMPSASVYLNRFKSIKNVYDELNIEIPEDKTQYFSDFRNCTDEQLLDILEKYNQDVGFPTQRKFKSRNNLPSYSLYVERFGSFKNALLIANINIPKDRERFFNRESLSDEDMLNLLKYYTDKKLEHNIYLLTLDEIDNIKNIPSASAYVLRFGGIIEAYLKIGIDCKEFNNEALEKDMIKKYKKLYNILGKTPHSRDIEEYSRQRMGFYSMSTYEHHFGGIYQLQIYCNFLPTIIGRHKTKQEMIDDLQELYEQLGRIPTQKDVNVCEWISSTGKYTDEFGSLTNALFQAGIQGKYEDKRYSITPQGNFCRSSYEYDFCVMLENNNFDFSQEEYYKNYITNYEKRSRFDFTIRYNNEIYFIEIFGMMECGWYRDKTDYKIKICNDNQLKLIDLYKKDFMKSDSNTLYKLLIDKINNINNTNVLKDVI
jgi:hypothetical protein